MVGGEGQPSGGGGGGGGGGGAEETGLRARAVYDYEAGMYAVIITPILNYHLTTYKYTVVSHLIA